MFNNKKIFYLVLSSALLVLLIFFQYTVTKDASDQEESSSSNEGTNIEPVEVVIIDDVTGDIKEEEIIISNEGTNIEPVEVVIIDDVTGDIIENKLADKQIENIQNSSFDIVRIDRDGASVLAGRSEPDKIIRIYNEGILIGEGKADKNGQWVIIIDEKIPNEILNLTVSSANNLDDIEIFSDQVVTIMPNQVEYEYLIENGKKNNNDIVLLTQEDKASQILSDDPSFLQDENKVNIRTIDYNEEKLILGGNAEVNTDINAYIDNKYVGTTRSDDFGKWTLNIKENIIPGDYEIRADMIGDGNFVIARTRTKFTSLFDDLTNDFQLNSITIKPGDNLWNISRTKYGSGMQYTVLYLANSNQIVDPDLIFPGQILMVPGS
jgi:nucleoid-associated protein YgaU